MPLVDGGFPADANPAAIGIRSFQVPGSAVSLQVRADVAPLLIGFAAWFHANVEPLHPGECGGYNYRNKKSGNGLSNHAAGIAIDLNSLHHPWAAVGTFRAEIVPEIRRVAALFGLRWGGDYHSTRDEMHFEVHLPIAEAQALARKVPGAKGFPPSVAPQPNADVAVLDLTAVGQARSLQLIEALTASTLTRTIDGASAVTIRVQDPHRVLVRGLAAEDPPPSLTVAGVTFGLAGVTKQADSLDLTFEDMVAIVLRQQRGFKVVEAHTVSRTEFAQSLVSDVPAGWIKFAGQTSQLVAADGTRSDDALSKEQLSRGTEQDPDTESTWEALGRIAADVGWRRFSDGRTLYFGGDEWLRRRLPAVVLSEADPGVTGIDFKWDIGLEVAEATVTCNFTRAAFAAGGPVIVEGCGRADGDWIVKSTKRALESPQGTVTLQRPQADKAPLSNITPEPSFPGGAPGAWFTGVDSGDRSGLMQPMDIAKLAYDAGFPPFIGGQYSPPSATWSQKRAAGMALQTAVAVALYESNGGYVNAINTKNRNGTVDRGLWQINSVHGDYDPHLLVTSARYNAKAAVQIWRAAGNSFTPWSSYNGSGPYKSMWARAFFAIRDAGLQNVSALGSAPPKSLP